MMRMRVGETSATSSPWYSIGSRVGRFMPAVGALAMKVVPLGSAIDRSTAVAAEVQFRDGAERSVDDRPQRWVARWRHR